MTDINPIPDQLSHLRKLGTAHRRLTADVLAEALRDASREKSGRITAEAALRSAQQRNQRLLRAINMAGGRNQRLLRAINMAGGMLEPHEPGDSRAVSNEFAALACILKDGDANGRVMMVIDSAIARMRAHELETGVRRPRMDGIG